jgi:hypothetical protein
MKGPKLASVLRGKTILRGRRGERGPRHWGEGGSLGVRLALKGKGI